MRNRLIIVFVFTLSLFSYTATGQKLINSPYSRFNLGTLQAEGSFRSLGMGGTGVGMRDNNSIYFSNPASYSGLDTNSFVFDFGADYGKNYISDGAIHFSSSDLNFHHLILGFPLAKGFGVAFGVIPMSSGFYEITGDVTKNDPNYDPLIGEYIIDHKGDGGITKLFLGTGIKILKNLSIGANMTFLTGQIKRTNQFVFGEYTTVYHNTSQEQIELTGINFDLGLQYHASLKNNYFLNLGASLTGGKNYNTKYNQLSFKYSAYSVTDTILYVSDNQARTYIPSTLRFGASFGRKNKFTTGIDYIMTNWSSARIPGSAGYTGDTRMVLFGAEYIPDRFSNYSFINRLQYRVGGHTGTNYLVLNGEQIKEYGASAGLGIPIRKSASTANVYVDYTRKKGLLGTSIHNENYLTIGFSLNLYDWWFLKKKYD